MNYYKESCPKAEEIIRQQVETLYYKHGNTAVSWLRNLFHDCVVKVYSPEFIRHRYLYEFVPKKKCLYECSCVCFYFIL